MTFAPYRFSHCFVTLSIAQNRLVTGRKTCFDLTQSCPVPHTPPSRKILGKKVDPVPSTLWVLITRSPTLVWVYGLVCMSSLRFPGTTPDPPLPSGPSTMTDTNWPGGGSGDTGSGGNPVVVGTSCMFSPLLLDVF